MISRSYLARRGIIGFVVTMALGVAIGAAALLVGNEVAKNLEGKAGGETATSSISPELPLNFAQELEESFREYREARQAYEQAVAAGDKDLAYRFQVLRKAKARLEKAISLNTPIFGSSETLQPHLPVSPVSSQPAKLSSFIATQPLATHPMPASVIPISSITNEPNALASLPPSLK